MLQIKSIKFRNPIGMPPMCQYSSQDGYVRDWHLHHYATRSVGGVGLAIVEATSVTPDGRITPYDLGIWSDDHVKGLSELAATIERYGAVPGIQIAHAGRKASFDRPFGGGGDLLDLNNGGWIQVAPSAIPFNEGERLPHALTPAEIQDVVKAFGSAARRAKEAGFKVLELHGAHGYLIHQFLSPLSNQRTDQYGGTFENRIRFLLEVLAEVKKEWPADLPLFVRLSATDWAEGGWNPDETVRLAEVLKKEGVDLIDCSTGGLVPHVRIPVAPLYQVEFARAVKQTGILVSAVGLITQRDEILQILENGDADMVLLGRELLRNPYFVLRNFPEWGLTPLQYDRA